MARKCRMLVVCVAFVSMIFFYNEYLIYWQILSKCEWPKLSEQHGNLISLMILSDTHLLGSRNGHWFDKLRREWQQHRAFQTARHLLKPDYIIILGDITDEGKWCSESEVSKIYFTYNLILINTIHFFNPYQKFL